jgi:4-amino-4-deoxy-L-arabinose transferase-like glycosyltransferase
MQVSGTGTPDDRRLRGADYAILLVVSLLSLGYPLVHPRTLTSHETTHCQNVVEMLASGDWIIPTYGGRPWLERPPLPHWCTGLFAMLFGTGERGMEIGSMVAGFVSVVLVARLTALWYGRKMALLAAAVLVTQREFVQYATGAEADIFLSLLVLIAAALFIELEFVHRPADPRETQGLCGPRPRLVLFFVLATALTNLAKGPLFGTFFVALPLVGFFLWNGDWPGFRRYLWAWGLFAYVVVGAAWPLAAYLRYPDVVDLWHSDFGGRWNQGYIGEPWWYYAHALPWNLAPWTLCGFIGLAATARAAFREGGRAERYLCCWAILPVLLLSVFQGKHHHYLLPIMAPWAVLGAVGAASLWEAFGRASRWLRHPATGFLLVGVPLAIASYFGGRRLDGPAWLPQLLLVVGLACGGWLWLSLRQSRPQWASAGVVLLVIFLSHMILGLRVAYHDRMRDDREFIEACKTLTPADRPVLVMGDKHPLNASWFLFYLRERAKFVHNHTFLRDDRLPAREVYVIDHHFNRAALEDYGTVDIVTESRFTKGEQSPEDRWTLYRVRFRQDLERVPGLARISPMQATGRAFGPYLGGETANRH